MIALRALVLLSLFTACSEGRLASPSPSGSPSAKAPASSSTQAGLASNSAASSSSAGAPLTSPSASAFATGSALLPPPAPSALDLAAFPQIVGPDGATLPQTKDRPELTSPAFKRRLDLLWQAIVENDAALAEPAFFPKAAYELVKDIEKPGADWKHRLLKAFGRNISEYHKKLGDDPKALTFLGLDVDEKRVKWIDRGKEGNKLGYYRVTRSKLRYSEPGGKERTLELTSLISWRGEWFVVHLHGFK